MNTHKKHQNDPKKTFSWRRAKFFLPTVAPARCRSSPKICRQSDRKRYEKKQLSKIGDWLLRSVSLLHDCQLASSLFSIAFKPNKAQESFQAWPAALHLLHPVELRVVGLLVVKGHVNHVWIKNKLSLWKRKKERKEKKACGDKH